ncbi:acetyltransferase [Frigoribacterium sp. CFBP 8751]|uniref:acetyltransferase n=1 Tax=Frigoribacterium sp. CFBP 8751 TaxID=2775277 RepID=UPI00177BE30A|nr:acetyltransferase [Frigoribacterium sp. CFBP 8751]MBD8539745.1 acetyltransferase [Frigoribacterium sp. CFBP 8751]
MQTPAVLRDHSPEAAALLGEGWTVAARSFGARLHTGDVDRDHLRALATGKAADVTIRELGPLDVDAVLALDAQTLDDYPGSVATRHEPFDRSSATPGPTRRAWGAFTPTGRLVGLTVVDLDGPAAETDVTVVHSDHRGRGLAAAIKAASVLALLDAGVLRFRTGGSADNPAIVATNASLGYVVDEGWLTLVAPAP